MAYDYWSVDCIEQWVIALGFVNRTGVLVPAELRVFPFETWERARRGDWSGDPHHVPRRGLRARELRRMISLGRLLREVRPQSGLGDSLATRGRPPRIESPVLAELVQDHLEGRRVAELAKEYGIAWKRPAKLIDLAADRGLYDRRGRRLTDKGRALVKVVKLRASEVVAVALEDRGRRPTRRPRPVVTKVRHLRDRKPRGRRR